MDLRIIEHPAGLEALRTEWEFLLLRSDSNEPTLSPDWLLEWWKVFGQEGNRALRAFAFFEGGRLVGLVPLLRRISVYHHMIPFRRFESLASGEDEADETCSDYLGPICEWGAEERVARALVDALAEDAPGRWDEVVLPSMAADSDSAVCLAREFARIGARVDIRPAGVCPIVPLPSSWEKYLAALPAQHRYGVRRALREFERWAEAPPELDVVSHREQIGPALDTLIALHAERWRARGGGAFASPRFRAFHRAIAPALFDRHALDLGILRAKGRPIAAFYNFVWNDKSYFYQSGRTFDVPRALSVGIVMHASLIRRAIERGLREYDFLAGASRYKLDLSLSARPLVTLRAARPRLVERARRTTEFALRGARTLRNALRAEGRT